MNKKSVLFGIALVFVLGITLESKAVQKEQPKMGGTLVFGLGKEPANPNPFIATASTTQFVKETSYESLLARDHEERIVPNLATTYEISSGGTVLTLHLRKGVKFHNGKEMRAGDVIWSANHVKDPKNGAYGHSLISNLKSIEKIDEYTVKFTLYSPSVVFLSYLSNIRMLPIVPANSLQSGQIKLQANTFVPGTGPFMYEKVQPGFDTVFKKHQEYWGVPAYLDKIIFRPITDSTNRFNALRTGDVHMADRLLSLDVARVKKGQIKGINILEEPLGGYQQLIMNYLNPLLQKREMRQALSYATDKQRLVDEAFFGAATTADMKMDPNSVWSKTANLPRHKYDVAKAKALLKAAGYSGQELAFPARKSAARLCESYQRMLSEAGIKIKVELLEAGVMRQRIIDGKYDLHIFGGDINPDPVVTMMPDYHTIKTEKGRYSNPKVDQLLADLAKEFDEKKRLKIFKELSWMLHNDVANLPLLYEIRFVGMAEKVQGYGPPQGYGYSESGNYFKHVWLK